MVFNKCIYYTYNHILTIESLWITRWILTQIAFNEAQFHIYFKHPPHFMKAKKLSKTSWFFFLCSVVFVIQSQLNPVVAKGGKSKEDGSSPEKPYSNSYIDVTRVFETPTPAQLASYRPSPPVVRGFMVGGARTLEKDTMKRNLVAAREWGANVLRLPLTPVEFGKVMNQSMWESWPEYLDRLEETVKIASELGMKLVIEMHSPPIDEIQLKGLRDKHEMWVHPDLSKNFLKAWTDIATRLKPYSKAIWAYDLYNEPVDRSQMPWPPKEWYFLAVDLTMAIRKIDPDVWVLYECGPGGWPKGFERLQPLPDTRVIYGCHMYHPGAFTHQGVHYDGDLYQEKDLQGVTDVHYPLKTKEGWVNKGALEKYLNPLIKFQETWKVPVFIGEFSVARWAPKPDAVLWLKDVMDIFEAHGWAWCYHSFREYHGWSLEYDETFWKKGMPDPKPVKELTDRAKVVRSYLERNRQSN